ncbi:MAG: aminotransferase class V-fold PLP-dependent enzyme [Bacteroidota bacterium]
MNIDHIREDIPCYGDKIFLNSAGSSLMPFSVVEKISEYLQKEEKLGGYYLADSRAEEIEDFYQEAAKLIIANQHNIAFTHDATDAYIKALTSIDFKPNDVIITTDDDYASNQIQFISLKKRFGVRVVRMKNLENGDLDIADFERLVEMYHPKLVAVSQVPTNSGLVQNAEPVGEICQREEIIYLVDACQSVGQLDVQVSELKCDFLSVTGRKFLRGPRGTGFLYVSDRMLNEGYAPLMIDGGGAIWKDENHYDVLPTAQRFETWEKPYALVVGLTEALRCANELGMKNIETQNQILMNRLRDNLSNISEVTQYDQGSKKCNILTFRKEGLSLQTIKEKLEQNNVFFSVSSREWGVIDYQKKRVDGTIRLSPHYFNTLEEMDRVAEIIADI